MSSCYPSLCGLHHPSLQSLVIVYTHSLIHPTCTILVKNLIAYDSGPDVLTIAVEPAPTNTMSSFTPIATSPATTAAGGGPHKARSVKDARARKGRPTDPVLDPATLEQRSKGRVRKAISRRNNPIRGKYTCRAYIASRQSLTSCVGKWVEVTTRARKDAEKCFRRDITAEQLWTNRETRLYAMWRCEMSLANTEAWSRENLALFFNSDWAHSEHISRSRVELLRTMGTTSSKRLDPERTEPETESAPPAKKRKVAAPKVTEPRTEGAKPASSRAASKPAAKAPAKPRTETPVACETPVARKAPVGRKGSKAVGSKPTKKSSSPQQASLPDLLAEDADAGPKWPKKQAEKAAASVVGKSAAGRGHCSGMVTRAVARAAEREELEAAMEKHDVHALDVTLRKDSASAVVNVLLDAARTLEAAETLLALAGQ